MIYCLVTREHSYTVREFLQIWGRPLRLRFRFIYYEELVRWHALPVGTYLFTDLERLSPQQMSLAQLVAQRLEASPDPLRRIVNDPRRVLLRYELLQTLHQRGMNPFRAWRVAEVEAALRQGGDCYGPRLPVFLRHEDDHSADISGLISDRRGLECAISQATASGARKAQLLVVEYCHTADDGGAFWKYAAFRIGPQVFPHHLMRRTQWVAKSPSDLTPERFARENEMIARRPHDAQIREIFEIAGIEYGRIDYSTVGGGFEGRLVTWEINTNPSVMLAPEQIADERLLARAQVARWLCGAYEALDLAPLYAKPQSHVELKVPQDLAALLGYSQLQRGRDRALRGLKGATRWKLLRPVRAQVGRFLPRGPEAEAESGS